MQGFDTQYIQEKYYKKIVNIAMALGVERAQAEKELMKSIKFEIEISTVRIYNLH